MAELSLTDLTRAVQTPAETVLSAEKNYHDKIRSLAEETVRRGARIVFLAGPSAAGKTTSANLLSDAVKALGTPSVVVSLDNFYRDNRDPDYPRLPNGERDLETVDALDLGLISSVLHRVLHGESFAVPHYDFKIGRADGEPYRFEGSENSVVIVEGLHALNPKISGTVDPGLSLRVFVSVSTNLTDGGKRLLSGKKMRFLRRLVRDSLYRGASADHTLSLWENVLAGELKYLYPFKSLADVTVDTFHLFELPVLVPFAKATLEGTPADTEFLKTVCDAIRKIPAMDVKYVPEDSLIKEFIPGGIYEHLY